MEYAWYWLDDSGQWIEYGEEHPDHCTATVKSADLEKKFLADQKGIVLFRAGSQKYELNFEDMVQKNLIFETQRKVARLPKFLSSQGGQHRSQNMTLSRSVCPPQWDQSALPDIGFKLVQLSYTSSEYGKIKRLFEKTMKDYCIHQLQRIQNPTLWQVFQWQKEQMKKLNKSKWVDERLLFHGTSPSHMPAICEQNFDWRICGTHGTMYGKGGGVPDLKQGSIPRGARTVSGSLSELSVCVTAKRSRPTSRPELPATFGLPGCLQSTEQKAFLSAFLEEKVLETISNTHNR